MVLEYEVGAALAENGAVAVKVERAQAPAKSSLRVLRTPNESNLDMFHQQTGTSAPPAIAMSASPRRIAR